MNNTIERALNQFMGCSEGSQFENRDDLAHPENPNGMPIAAWGISKSIKRNLAWHGYANISDFVALPSRESPRWLLPSAERRQTLEALQMFQPNSTVPRLLKWLLSGAIQLGWTRWAQPHLLVASTKPLPLELLVTELTGEMRPVFTLSFGGANRYRKLTVQVSHRDGARLGYIKLPLTEAATSRVRHEAETLERLWNFPALRPHIPKLLHAGKWEGGYMLFQTPGPIGRGPLVFGSPHQQMLRTLWSVHRTMKLGHVLVKEVAARWQQFALVLDQEWQQLGRRALELAHSSLNGKQIPCGIKHGDFAPTNTRAENARLFVFDWEYASWEAPVLWDIFEFHVRTGRMCYGLVESGIPFGKATDNRASFVLYLLNSVCEMLDAESPGMEAVLRSRRRTLLNELAELSAT